MRKAAKKRTMAEAFDEWLRRYIEDPSAFEAEFQSVSEYQKGPRNGSKASEYGHAQAKMLRRLMRGE